MAAEQPPSSPPRRNEQHRCAHCGSRFEVWHTADPLGTYVAVEVPCPCCGAPTVTEMGPYRPGPPTRVSPHVTFDPGCVGKSVLKALKGKNDTYYLYRIRDTHGERVSLYDRKLEPKTFQGDLELIGRFTGECDALAAYRREEARTASPAPGPSATPSASPSPGPS